LGLLAAAQQHLADAVGGGLGWVVAFAPADYGVFATFLGPDLLPDAPVVGGGVGFADEGDDVDG
jgi:hypothetical protein